MLQQALLFQKDLQKNQVEGIGGQVPIFLQKLLRELSLVALLRVLWADLLQQRPELGRW